MATRTLTELIAEARQRADSTSDDSFITDAEITRYLNQSIKELYDLLIQCQGQEFYQSSSTTAIVAGTATYSLPATFYKLLGVDLNLTGGRVVSARPYVFKERNAYSGAASAKQYRVWYRIHGSSITFIPAPDMFSSFTIQYIPAYTDLVYPDIGNTSLDGINGWEEYAIVDTAMKMLEKEESDTSALMARKLALKQRIESLAASRDVGDPERITDVYGDISDWDY